MEKNVNGLRRGEIVEIFCKNCKFLFVGLFSTNTKDSVYFYGWRDVECFHLKNVKKKVKRSFYEENISYEYLLKPSEINKDNNCPFFREGEHPSKKLIRERYGEKEC